MNVDAILLGLLAVMDLVVVIQLRRVRARHTQSDRVTRSMRFLVERELRGGTVETRVRRPLVLRRAS